MSKITRNWIASLAFCGALAMAMQSQGQGLEKLILMPQGDATVAVDGVVNLTLRSVDANGDLEISDAPVTNVMTWTINGQTAEQFNAKGTDGKFNLNFISAAYHAPHVIPATNPVAVAVTFRASAGSSATTTLVCNIKVVGRKNFLSVGDKDLPAQYFELSQQYASPATLGLVARGIAVDSMINVTVQAMEGSGKGNGQRAQSTATSTLLIESKAPGEYKWVLPPGRTFGQFMIVSGSSVNIYSAADCVPHGSPNCKARILPGTIRVLGFDPKTNQLTGEFQGTVVKMVNGKPTTYTTASGSFAVAVAGASVR